MKPDNLFVLILGLGLNDWEDTEDKNWERHKTLHSFFKQVGVPAKQILFCENEEGHPDILRKTLPQFLENSDKDSVFFFYYAGHGDIHEEYEDFYFCHPDTDDGVTAEELFDIIEEHFGGSQAVLLADCCYSGRLADWVEHRSGQMSYAVLTSATSDIISTGNWTFTDCILSALQGNSTIDADENGTITFPELCDYVLSTMNEIEEQPAQYAVSEDFDSSFRLAVVTT